MSVIGNRIFSLREDLDISQAKLAGKIGVTKATMSKYENGISTPKADIIGKIADVLNTTTDYLIGRIDAPVPYLKNENWVKLTTDEVILFKDFRKLSKINQSRIAERVLVLKDEQIK